MAYVSSDVAFSPTVKAVQARRGSRAAYAEMERSGGFATEVTPELAEFIAERDSFYLATASADGQPYIQHRGGPKGFLRVLGPTTLAFADYRGNRQYISTGNLTDNPRAFIFLMDYANRQRIKIWGRAQVVENDPALVASLMPPGHRAKPEQAIFFEIAAWNSNCPQHIPVMINALEVAPAVESLQARVKALEAENATLRSENDGR